LSGVIMMIVEGQFASRTTAPNSQRQSTAEKRGDSEKPADDGEVRLHHAPAPIGQLSLDEERAVVELWSRGMLGDLDVDRGSGE
jgi:hypothetical protein